MRQLAAKHCPGNWHMVIETDELNRPTTNLDPLTD